jgi:hypothetical protein
MGEHFFLPVKHHTTAGPSEKAQTHFDRAANQPHDFFGG